MIALPRRFVSVLLVHAAIGGCMPVAPVDGSVDERPRCEPDLSQHLDIMDPEPREQLIDTDCDTVPDVDDACPEVVGVPQPLASRAGCPLDLDDAAKDGR